jgi:hypothetical protein
MSPMEEPRDVFVSYAHIDDEPPGLLPQGWVTFFVTELLKELNKKAGGRKIVWMDGRLQPNDLVPSTLITTVRASRTLVLFMSPSYQASTWCQRELITFLEANGTIKNKESVFIIEVEPVPRESLHPRLQELTPLRFWEKDSLNRGAARRLGHPIPSPDEDSPYWRRLNELAHLICEHLKETSQLGPSRSAAATGSHLAQRARQEAPPRHQDTKPIVWLAEPTEDLIEHWEELATAVRQAGCDLRPLGPATYARSPESVFLEAVRRDLGQAFLAVQLLSESPDIDSSVEEDFAGRARLQNSLAIEWAERTGRPFLQWRAPDVDLSKIAHALHRQCLTGAISSGFEEFRQRVVNTILVLLAVPMQARHPSASPVRGGKHVAPSVSLGTRPLAICVNADRPDKSLARGVVDILRNLGADILSAPDPSPNQVPAEFHAQLDQVIGGSEGVIIVYGETPPAWVQAQYVRARKVLAQRRQGIWGALLDGPPSTKPAHGIVSQNIISLNCRNGLNSAQIARFVDTLRMAPNA